MDMIDTIHEMLDSFVQRLEDEKECTGRDLTYFVFVTDAGTGRGDLRFDGDVDQLAGMMLRLHKGLLDHVDIERMVVEAVEGMPDSDGSTDRL